MLFFQKTIVVDIESVAPKTTDNRKAVIGTDAYNIMDKCYFNKQSATILITSILAENY
jgi:hypothetical protein